MVFTLQQCGFSFRRNQWIVWIFKPREFLKASTQSVNKRTLKGQNGGELAKCCICAEVFDSVVLIPKILQCGHTFCSPCVTRVTENNPRCPICGKEINERESSPITNFDTLSVVDIYNSNSNASSIREILTEGLFETLISQHWSILVETFRYCDVKHIHL
ncbi:E3 ubiquitin-protein ligase TRIM32 [Armadillidium vulgare]|nr:E3 ubiquitin-protein ligase TRIM32 [Armadillidium vulgare]